MSEKSQKVKTRFLTLPRLIIFALLVLLAVIGLWMTLRSAIAKDMTETITTLEQQGFEIGHGGLSVKGFPFTVEARTEDFSIRAPSSVNPEPNKNWFVNTEELDLYSSTLTPLSWSIQHTGTMRVDMRGIDGERYMFDVQPANIYSDFAVNFSGKLKRLHADIGRASVNSLVGAEPPVLSLAGLRADLDIKNTEGHIDILGKNLVFAEQYMGMAYPILGREVTRASVQARIEDWPVLANAGVAVWMQSPARVKSDNWILQWGNADIVGTFDLGFKNGLPDGVIRFRVKNAAQLYDQIVAAGLVPENMNLQMGAYIDGLGTDEENRKTIEIVIRDGVVKYGFITLYRF